MRAGPARRLDEDWAYEARDEHARVLGDVLARLAALPTTRRRELAWARAGPRSTRSTRPPRAA